jgi:hypothetical protein
MKLWSSNFLVIYYLRRSQWIKYPYEIRISSNKIEFFILILKIIGKKLKLIEVINVVIVKDYKFLIFYNKLLNYYQIKKKDNL